MSALAAVGATESRLRHVRAACSMVGRRGMTATRFPHGADIGVRGEGPTLAAAFAEAAAALSASVCDLDAIRLETPVAIECAAPNDAVLLVDWLNRVIYEMAVRRMLFSRFETTIANHRLRAVAWGERVDPNRHQPAVEPKGATFTELRVERRPDGSWLAQCVVDV